MDHPGRLERNFKLAGEPLHSPSVQRSDTKAVHGLSLAEAGFGGNPAVRACLMLHNLNHLESAILCVRQALLQEAT
jgi:hypothetical protein